MNFVRLLIFAAAVVLTACNGDSGVVRPPPTDLRVVHAASDFNAIRFVREEDLNEAIFMNFGEGGAERYDSGQYDLHLETFPFGASGIQRPLSLDTTLSPNLDYTLVILSTSGSLEVMTVTTPDEDPAASMTRMTIIGAHSSIGDLDVYLELEGTDLTTVTPRGSISFGPTPLVFEVASEVYHMYLTTAGDPTDVIYESVDLFITPDSDFVLVVSDPADQGFSPVMVTEVGVNTRRIGDDNERSAVRAFQGVNDRLNRDVLRVSDPSEVLVSSLPFGTSSGYVDIRRALHTVALTPEGNNTVFEESFSYTAVAGRYSTLLFAGDASDEIGGIAMFEDKRSISGQATATIMNIAGLFGALEVFITAPGADISEESPIVTLIAPGFQDRQPFLPGDHEVTIRDLDSQSILAGPVPISLSDGGVYSVLLLNAANGSSVDVVFSDDSAP